MKTTERLSTGDRDKERLLKMTKAVLETLIKAFQWKLNFVPFIQLTIKKILVSSKGKFEEIVWFYCYLSRQRNPIETSDWFKLNRICSEMQDNLRVVCI